MFSTSYASHKILNENFDDGNLNGWIVTRNNCLYNGNPATWEITNGRLVIKTNGGHCFTEIMPDDSLWGEIGNNYTVEFDMTLVTGADHTIAFRYTDPEHWYDFHIQTPERLILDSSGSVHYGNYSNGQTIHFKLVVNGRHVSVYRGTNPQTLIIDNPYVNADFPTGRIAPQAAPGGGELETHFDNIVVTSIDSEPNLSVPLLKQTSDPWQSKEYDSASKWSPSAPTINSWGCALTSAAMVLQYYGINKTPNGTVLDPGTLNDWLKSQPDGYVGNGLVNWLAISRFSRLAKLSGNNPEFAFKALEYDRISDENKKQQLTTDLNDYIPGILELPGHFVVGKGTAGDTFLINDPFYNRQKLSDGYDNQFISLGRYVPSNTDLSYIMAISDQYTPTVIKDSYGLILAESFTQNPIHNESEADKKAGNPLRQLYLKKPNSGKYIMSVTSDKTQESSVSTYLYSLTGDTSIHTKKILISKNNSESFTIDFDRDNVNNSSIKRVITFQTAIDDVHEAISMKLINTVLGKQIILLFQNAEKDVRTNRTKMARAKLQSISVLLRTAKRPLIKQLAYDILTEDIDSLSTALK